MPLNEDESQRRLGFLGNPWRIKQGRLWVPKIHRKERKHKERRGKEKKGKMNRNGRETAEMFFLGLSLSLCRDANATLHAFNFVNTTQYAEGLDLTVC